MREPLKALKALIAQIRGGTGKRAFVSMRDAQGESDLWVKGRACWSISSMRQTPLTVADTLQRRAELIRLGRAARQHNSQECDLQTRCLPAQVELLRRIGEAAIP